MYFVTFKVLIWNENWCWCLHVDACVFHYTFACHRTGCNQAFVRSTVMYDYTLNHSISFFWQSIDVIYNIYRFRILSISTNRRSCCGEPFHWELSLIKSHFLSLISKLKYELNFITLWNRLDPGGRLDRAPSLVEQSPGQLAFIFFACEQNYVVVT